MAEQGSIYKSPIGIRMREIFELQPDYDQKKVMPISEAIRQAITPGMQLHIATANDPNAALREIIRQFWGTDPKFTLISSGVTTPYVISLVHCGLLKKVITANCSYTYPTPRPIPLLQDAHKRGVIDIESWSLYSLEQRLMAAALGVGFLPTKSVIGTSLAEENAESFQIISDPFDDKADIGVVRAIEPDISFVHGCVADCYGNTILAAPYFTSIWGSRASKNGVIVTVEKLVSPEFIRKHSSLVKIPGYLVKSISVVPFGAHPQCSTGEAIGIDRGYGEDYEFIIDYQKASQERSKLDAWLNEWIIECNKQEDYLRKLGNNRLLSLKGRASSDAWKYTLNTDFTSLAETKKANPTEMMVVAAARHIKKKVLEGGYQAVLAGIGSPGLAAWLAYYLLRKENYNVTLLTGTGLAGYAPRPGDPFLMSPSNIMTCNMLTDTVEVYGTLVGGSRNKCLSVLGAAQIDKYGNINTLKIDDLYFIGPGGAGDAINAQETIVIAKQSQKRLLENVRFVSCPGSKVKTLVTDLGILEKPEKDASFILTKYFAGPGFSTQEQRIIEIKEKCGWEMNIAEFLEEIEPPVIEELAILRSIDPQGSFLGK